MSPRVHNARRIKIMVARSERGSAETRRVFEREAGVAVVGIGSFDAEADCEDIFEVASDFARGWRRDIP